MDNPFCFSSLEKSVVDEAKRTAEYFDSVEKLDNEADRIVEMLKSAAYVIAFTGMYILCDSEIYSHLVEGTMNNICLAQRLFSGIFVKSSWLVSKNFTDAAVKVMFLLVFLCKIYLQ